MTLAALIAPKGWVLLLWVVGAWGAVMGALQFQNTIGTGSIIVAAFVIILSGVFTLRGNLRSYWKDLAEERAEKIESLEQDVKDRDAKVTELQEQSREDLARVIEEQRQVRHELKNQLAAAIASLKVEEAKTDLSALMELLGSQHAEAMDRIVDGLGKQDQIIELLTGNATAAS